MKISLRKYYYTLNHRKTTERPGTVCPWESTTTHYETNVRQPACRLILNQSLTLSDCFTLTDSKSHASVSRTKCRRLRWPSNDRILMSVIPTPIPCMMCAAWAGWLLHLTFAAGQLKPDACPERLGNSWPRKMTNNGQGEGGQLVQLN